MATTTPAEVAANLNFQQPNATGSSEKKSLQPNRVIDRLFDRMVAEFGHKFTSVIPTESARESARAVWVERLAGLSVDEIKTGVEALPGYAASHDGWPPGAAEFRALCRPHREPYERPEFQARALPQLPAEKSVAQQHIAKLRNRLGAA